MTARYSASDHLVMSIRHTEGYTIDRSSVHVVGAYYVDIDFPIEHMEEVFSELDRLSTVAMAWLVIYRMAYLYM